MTPQVLDKLKTHSDALRRADRGWSATRPCRPIRRPTARTRRRSPRCRSWSTASASTSARKPNSAKRRGLAASGDAEMKALAAEEIRGLEAQIEALEDVLARAAHPARPERRPERRHRDPGRHGRRRSRAVCRRSLPDVLALRRTPGLEGRRAVDQRHGRRRPQGSQSPRSKARACTAGSNTRAACTACSACRPPRPAAASTRRRRRWPCCPRPRKSTSRSTRRTSASTPSARAARAARA